MSTRRSLLAILLGALAFVGTYTFVSGFPVSNLAGLAAVVDFATRAYPWFSESLAALHAVLDHLAVSVSLELNASNVLVVLANRSDRFR